MARVPVTDEVAAPSRRAKSSSVAPPAVVHPSMNKNADRALKHRLDQRRQESKRISSSSLGGSRRSAGRNEKQDRAQLILDVGLRMKMRESQLNAAARAT